MVINNGGDNTNGSNNENNNNKSNTQSKIINLTNITFNKEEQNILEKGYTVSAITLN